jgi:crossover junction endodeoxyribonuclease RuvC
MKLCGIDPGITGAFAFVEAGAETAKLLGVVAMPMTIEKIRKRKARAAKRTHYDWFAVAAILREHKPDLVILESQWPRPGEGVSSSFKAGMGYGGLLAVLATLGCAHEIVHSATWKAGMGLRGSKKEASRLLAIELMAEGRNLFARKMDHGRAEAALIALWRTRQ